MAPNLSLILCHLALNLRITVRKPSLYVPFIISEATSCANSVVSICFPVSLMLPVSKTSIACARRSNSGRCR